MINKMKLDARILTELDRYRSINKYVTEQEAPVPAPDSMDPSLDSAEPLPDAPVDAPQQIDTLAPSQPVTPETDPDVEKISDNGESEETESTEELDITDLVKSQKNVEQKQDDYFKNLFSQLEGLQSKLSEMDGIVQKLNTIETKIEKYRQKTPQEKLELRSLDSGPYTQKLTDFFTDKEGEMEASGKNEYVLTPDEVKNYSDSEIKGSFTPPTEDENI